MIRIEHLADQHLPAVASLHRRIFGSTMSAEDLRWKYSPEHTGADHGCFVALDGDDAVAFHGGLSQVFELAGRSVLVGQSCDSMASPTVQGKGVYGELLKRTEGQMFASGAALLYGAANQSSERAVLRSGWRRVGPPLSRFRLQVPTLPMARAVWRVRQLRPIVALWARRGFSNDLSALDTFVNSLAGADALVHRYSPAWFRFKAPNRGLGVRFGDVRAWLKVAPDIVIGDLHAPHVGALRAFLDRLVGLAKALGVTAVHCYAFPGTPMDAMLGEILARQTGHQVLVSPSTPADLAERLRIGLADLDTF